MSTATHYRPILASRIRPSGIHENGLPDVSRWDCPRCGQRINNRGSHLIFGAPCRDCRGFLREEYGDETQYDRRWRPAPVPPVLEHVVMPVDAGPVGWWLAAVGVDLWPEWDGDWAA